MLQCAAPPGLISCSASSDLLAGSQDTLSCLGAGCSEKISGWRGWGHAVHLRQGLRSHDPDILPGGWICDVGQLAQPGEQRNCSAIDFAKALDTHIMLSKRYMRYLEAKTAEQYGRVPALAGLLKHEFQYIHCC